MNEYDREYNGFKLQCQCGSVMYIPSDNSYCDVNDGFSFDVSNFGYSIKLECNRCGKKTKIYC